MKARFLALAALVLGLASCQNDFEAGNIVAGGEVDFQLSVATPELATRAGEDGADTQNAKDSAFGAIDYLQGAGWSSVDLRYSLEVYDVTEDTAGNKVVTNTTPVKDRMVKVVDAYEPVVFDLRLVPNREYRFVVFADFVGEDATDTPTVAAQATIGLRHDIGDTLQDITIKENTEETKRLNDEVADAYFAFKDIEITNSKAQDMVLRRPYGKLRVIATDLAELNLNVDPKAVVVKYDRTHNNQFNAVTGIISGGNTTESTYKVVYNNSVGKESLADHTYTDGYDAKTVKNANNETRHSHITLFTDYILAEAEQTPIHFTMKVYDNAAMADTNLIKETAFTTDIPVQRNYLTTVIGNVLTTATEIEVRIDDNFAGEYIYFDDTETTESFAKALKDAEQCDEAIIDLAHDVTWATGAAIGSTPWIPEGAKTQVLTVNANGHKITATGSGVGQIRMANGGKLIINNAIIEDKSVSYAENSWEYGYLEFGGKLEFNECQFVNAVMMSGEEATFNKCTFNSNKDSEYGVWVDNGKAYFNECTVAGPRGIKTHEAYGSEVVEIIVDKCAFNNISKKPGMAIGTMNAETAITIKNSTFTNCQPGDQGLYIYETDTDVTTFDFVEQNNTVSNTVTAGTNLNELLKQNVETINIELAADAELNASDAYLALGGEDTKLIVIDGKKLSTAAATGAAKGNYKLTLTTTYWSRFTTKNPEAKVILRNLTLTSTQESGTWNSYDVTLNCNVDLENVELLKAVAFDGDKTTVNVKNVTIKESHDYYAMWISAAGQTVNIENLVIESAGRGIKIDEEYVNDAVAKVTLNINNAKFTTANKAAIMVKSAKGADITLQNVDITAVKKDTLYPVWVDEDAAAYADLVTVTGGLKKVEGATATLGSETIPAGTYKFPAASNFTAETVLTCEEGTVFTGTSSLNINGATVIGATFENTGSAVSGTVNGTFKKCTFKGGSNGLRNCYIPADKELLFEDCVFYGYTYGVHFDGGNKTGKLVFRNCDFTGWNSFASTVAKVEFYNCDFHKSGYGYLRFYQDGVAEDCTFDADFQTIDYGKTGCTTDFRNCTRIDGVFDKTIYRGDIKDNTIYIDGKKLLDYGVYEAAENVYELASKDAMFWFANEVNVNKNSFAGKTVKLAANIDLENAAWTPVGQTGATTFNGVFDGQNYTISNLNVNSEAQTGANYSSGLFGWVESHTAGNGHLKNVKINGATIVGNHNCGALVGYITQETALVDNCHVTGAAVSCLNANSDANGDKAGALIGNATVATPVKNCTATDSTVSAGRDAGQVIGAAKEANVTGCSATNVNVEANGTGTGANVRNEVIGRLLS